MRMVAILVKGVLCNEGTQLELICINKFIRFEESASERLAQSHLAI